MTKSALDAIDQAAAAAQTTPAAQAIQQNTQNSAPTVDSVFQSNNPNANAVAVAQGTAVGAVAPASALGDDMAVSAGSVEYFVKMQDDAVEINGVKIPGGIDLEIIVESVTRGGGLQRFVGFNYEVGTANYYTSSTDGLVVTKGQPDQVGKPWNQHKAEIQAAHGTPFGKTISEYQGHHVQGRLHKDALDKEGKVVVPAGTIVGFSTTATSNRHIDILKSKALAEKRSGQTVVVNVQGVQKTNAAKKNYIVMQPLTVLKWLDPDAGE